ncbi:MAG: peptide chain release factor N(5)-glutamine methyltransferase [Prevotella sp.]|nr:peptide chain release factor N(5)-glutamine methyltransferase [Prevotella sp.]
MTDSFCPTADRFRATNYRELCRRLAERYGLDEARAIVRWVLGECFGLSMADILCDKVTELSADDRTDLEKMMLRLENGEPVQYVLGFADFCGRRFFVTPEVLIPRPETEELCRWIVDSWSEERETKILDIGTGSGCIAITLAAEMPDAQVSAWDISEQALAVARKNADSIGVKVNFEQVDVLNLPFTINNSTLNSQLSTLNSHLSPTTYHLSPITCIVSNPPYICDNEKIAMKSHVLEHEPHVALFVPNDDPLLFYRAIADFAIQSLKPDGWLYFEVNPLYIKELKTMLAKKGFENIEVKIDQFGKERMTRAKKSKMKI